MPLFSSLLAVSRNYTVLVSGSVLALFVVAHRIYVYRRLRAFRGPFFANFSEFWVLRATLAGTLHEESLEVINEYGGDGSIARFGPNLLITTDATWWKSINEDRSWKKGSWYPAMALDPGHDSVFSTTDDAVHDRLKNQLTRGVWSSNIDRVTLLTTFTVFGKRQPQLGKRYSGRNQEPFSVHQ
jgi:hypothetical protein